MVAIAHLALLGLASVGVFAHPGHEEHGMDRTVKRSFLQNSRRSLDSCADKLKERGTLQIAAERRQAFAADLSKKIAALKIRDTADVLNTSHHSDLEGSITVDTDPSTLFTSNSTCILNPEGEVGPFWVKGEINREDILEDEPGVVSYLSAQFIDVTTCEPIENLWWDVWNCNSTGVYSGIQNSANGNGDDASNLDNTALRGIQATDSDGIAQFKTLFPGHYSGRTTHVHVIAHLDATELANGTITGGTVSHIGQFFWDQDLIYDVEATYPYNTNTQEITLNADDHVIVDETEDSASDPFFEYVLLGDDVSDGIYSWITVAVDPSATYEASYAATLTEDGGVPNEDSTGPGGPPSA